MELFHSFLADLHVGSRLEEGQVAICGEVVVLIETLRCDGVVGAFKDGVAFEEHEVWVLIKPVEDIGNDFKIHVFVLAEPIWTGCYLKNS